MYFTFEHFFVDLSLQEKMQMAAQNRFSSIEDDGSCIAGKNYLCQMFLFMKL